jgi:hypothetical protein
VANGVRSVPRSGLQDDRWPAQPRWYHRQKQREALRRSLTTAVTPTNWFRDLLGFDEQSYAETKQQLSVRGGRLIAPATGASYDIGMLEIPSLGELRSRVGAVAPERSGATRVSTVVGDVGELHRRAENRHALLQVASQFNLLEMTGPEVTPEDGVTRYAHDRTQGPACAIAAGAATVYRNYCVPVGDGTGQTRDRQIDCLRDVGTALSSDGTVPWTMRNGYALCSRAGLASVNTQLRPATKRRWTR